MNQPSNPFLQETGIVDFKPDIADFEQELIDSAVREEIKAGRLSGLLLTPAAQARILGDRDVA